MNKQDWIDVLNGFLSVTFVASLGALTAVFFWFLGRARGRRDATTSVQHALDRAARDIRLYSINATGAAAGEFARRALQEAEFIVRWRTAPHNIDTTPEGVSRMRPPGEPRSVSKKKDLLRRNQRLAIINLGYPAGVRADDTYAGGVKAAMSGRYNGVRRM